MKRLAHLRELVAALAFAGLVFYAGGVTPVGRFGFQLSAIVLALLVVVEWLQTGRAFLPNRLAFAATSGFVGYLLIRAFFPEPARPSLDEVLYWVTGFILYLALVHHFHDRQRLERMIVYLALTAIAAALIGLLTVYQAEGAEQLATPGIWKLSGTYVNRNHFALLLVTLIPLTYYAGIAFRSSSSTSDLLWERSGFLFLLSAVLLVTLLITGSIGGLMAFCVTAATITLDYLLHRTSGSRRHLLEAVLGAAVVVTLTLLWFGGEFLTGRIFRAASASELSAIDRAHMWKAPARMLMDHPVIGIGPGRFADYFPSYRPPEILYRVDHAHNDLLELAAEIGLVGMVILAISILLFFMHVFSSRNEIRSVYDRSMVRGGTASLAGMFVHSLLDFGMRLPANAFAVTCVLAAVTASASHRQSDEEARLQLSGWKRFAAALPPLIGLALYGTVSYRSFADSYYYRRAESLQSSDPQAALRNLDSADRRAPLPSDSRATLRARLLAKNPDQSQTPDGTIAALYEQAIRMNPVRPENWRERGLWRARAGDFHGAEADLIRAVELSPHDWRPLHELATIQWKSGDYGTALVNFGLLLAERPAHTGAILNAIASDPEKHALRLKALYPAIAETFPRDAPVRIQIADHLMRFGLQDEARQEYERAVSAEPENIRYLLKLVDILRKAGDYNGAIRRLDSFHEHYKGIPASYEARGDLARLNQEVADAVAAYRKALDLEPDQPGIWKKLYNAYVEFQADPGIRFWQDLAKRFPDRNVYTFFYAQELAKTPSTAGDAVREMRVIVSREPANWEYSNFLAGLHLKRRLHEEARRVWFDYAGNNPLDPRPYEQAARMYDGLKLPDRAQEARAFAEAARQRAKTTGR